MRFSGLVKASSPSHKGEASECEKFLLYQTCPSQPASWSLKSRILDIILMHNTYVHSLSKNYNLKTIVLFQNLLISGLS